MFVFLPKQIVGEKLQSLVLEYPFSIYNKSNTACIW